MPEVLVVYQKNNDMEADAPPANKSRIALCVVFSIYKFVSKILSLNILHYWRGEKGIWIEEEHERAGGDGFQL